MTKPLKLTEREKRFVDALRLKPIWREKADRIAGAFNSPHIIGQLRRKGFVIDCLDNVPKIDRDGKTTYPGRYDLRSEPDNV